MQYFSKSFERLVTELSNLPGVGYKSAGRLAFYIINAPKGQITDLISALQDASQNVKHCKICNSITDEDICYICKDVKRDRSQIMVVENERDMLAYEKSGEYKGLYHVLGGVISPLLDIGPNDLKIKELISRIKDEVKEIILATNSSIEGDTTATYIKKLLKPFNIKITRIASGVPVGGDLENIDEITLKRAYNGRVEV